jgi:predicted phosphodiesterase
MPDIENEIVEIYSNNSEPVVIVETDVVSEVLKSIEHEEKLTTQQAIQVTRNVELSNALFILTGNSKDNFLYYDHSNKTPIMSLETYSSVEQWFIVGDIHGDYYALRNIVEHIQSICSDFGLIFLGDLIDRGPYPVECLYYLLNLAATKPNRIIWIAGNHDIGVAYSKNANMFYSRVMPAEFISYLNAEESDSNFRKFLGLAFIQFVSKLPRAILLPDGTLITHGGFPLTDTHSQIINFENKIDWLNTAQALQDFSWTRISRFKMKFPNRESMGCSYGYEDFAKFCMTTQDFFPCKRLVTGHDHPEGGYEIHQTWIENPALTLTGFAFANAYENKESFNSLYRDQLIVARCLNDALPEVIQIPVDKVDLGNFYLAEIEPSFINQTLSSKLQLDDSPTIT